MDILKKIWSWLKEAISNVFTAIKITLIGSSDEIESNIKSVVSVVAGSFVVIIVSGFFAFYNWALAFVDTLENRELHEAWINAVLSSGIFGGIKEVFLAIIGNLWWPWAGLFCLACVILVGFILPGLYRVFTVGRNKKVVRAVTAY